MGRGVGAGPARGDGGRAGSWLRTYDRVMAMVGESQGQVEALLAGRKQLEAVNELQHEFWEARDGVRQSHLLQAEESRKKWEAAYMDLLPEGDHRKFAELQESDLEDSRTFIDLLAAENSELKIQLMEVGSCIEHNKQNTADHEHAARSLRAELGKLKEAHETLSPKKDKEVVALIAEKDFVLNQLRRKKEDHAKLHKNMKIEVARATEDAEKLQQRVEDLQVVAQKKDGEISRLRAEVLATKKKLQEMLSSAKEKDEKIHNLCRENDLVQNQLDVMEQDNVALLKDKKIEAAQAMEAAQKLQQNLEELHVEMDARIGRSRADAARKMVLEMRSLVMEKDQEYEKLEGWHPGTSRKRKYASSLSDDDEQNGKDEEAMGNLVQEPLKKKGPEKRELQEEERKGMRERFLGCLSDLGSHFTQVERERNQLRQELEEAKKELTLAREFTSQALAGKDDAVRRATDSEAKLEILRKESKAALDRAKLEAQERAETLLAQTTEREDRLADRLHALAEALAHSEPRCPSPVDDGLTDAMTVVEDYGAQAKDLITRVASTLATFYSSMFAEDPKMTLGELVEVFSEDPDLLVGYGRAHAVSGLEATLMMVLAHGVPEGDLKKATSGFPKGPDGQEVDVKKPFVKPARRLAKQLASLLDRVVAEMAAAK